MKNSLKNIYIQIDTSKISEDLDNNVKSLKNFPYLYSCSMMFAQHMEFLASQAIAHWNNFKLLEKHTDLPYEDILDLPEVKNRWTRIGFNKSIQKEQKTKFFKRINTLEQTFDLTNLNLDTSKFRYLRFEEEPNLGLVFHKARKIRNELSHFFFVDNIDELQPNNDDFDKLEAKMFNIYHDLKIVRQLFKEISNFAKNAFFNECEKNEKLYTKTSANS